MSKIYEALIKANEDREPLRLVDVETPVSHATELRELVVLNEPDSPMAECFRFLRSRITRPISGTPPRSILVTSAIMGEGKTFVAANLAASVSLVPEGRVLLIDGDLRAPSVHKILGMGANREGLSTYLAKDVPWGPLIQKTVVENLSALTAGNSTDIPAEILSSHKMKRLMTEVSNHRPNELIIVDSPPLELTPESFMLSQEVDAILMVVRHGFTPRGQVQSALDRIQKEKLLGIVYNGYSEASTLYDQYPYYGYGYKKKRRHGS